MAEPQFILWMKDLGVFSTARMNLETPRPHDWYNPGYDIERNSVISGESIKPSSLQLIASSYLGPINIFEEQNDSSKDAHMRRADFEHGVVYGVVKMAEELAKGNNVPYFTVVNATSPKNKTWKFEENDNDIWIKSHIKDNEYFETFHSKPKIPLEFVLHPTAQFYVVKD